MATTAEWNEERISDAADDVQEGDVPEKGTGAKQIRIQLSQDDTCNATECFLFGNINLKRMCCRPAAPGRQSPEEATGKRRTHSLV